MQISIINKKAVVYFIFIIAVIFLASSPSFGRMVTQIIPTVTITEEYSDNYLKTESNKTEEFITTTELGFSMGFLEKNHKLYLSYNPMYKFYKEQSENDGLDHSASINGEYRPSKNSNLGYGVNYSRTAVDRVGETRTSNAYASGSVQIAKMTSLTLAQDYSRNFDQDVTTGDYLETDMNDSSIGITHQFGLKDSIGFDYAYSFTEYENPNSNDFDSHSPSINLQYYFTPHFGMETNFSYETVDYDFTNNNTDTFSGDIRLIRNYTKHLDVYIKYRQTHSDQTNDTHNTFHPSVGFDWSPTEDSGISLGAGVIIREYDIQSDNDSENLFLDLDMYKNFSISRRSILSVTGSSGYGEVDSDAASLGFNTYYQAGFNYTYKLTKRLNADIIGSYKLSEYDNPDSDRTDAKTNIGASLSWSILKWLQLNLAYDFTDFDTDSSTRNDYKENQVTVSLSFIPSQPIRMDMAPSRAALENKIFNY